MQICPHCSKENSDAEAYCYACGHILPAALSGLTSSTMELSDVYGKLEPQRRWGTAYFDRKSRLQLTFRDSGEVLILEVGHRLVLGRAHEEPGIEQPDVDLSPYDALEKGVSRRHMMVSREHDTVAVMDLGSANSTYLNGQRLLPSEPRILRDNDELRLGRLVIRVTFAREN